jgi:ELWxxDGT repeat protein
VGDLAFFGGWPSPFSELNGRLYFMSAGAELWSTDGSAAGTSRVSAVDPAALGTPTLLVTSGKQLFFPVHLQATGEELWTSDGTEAGTLPLPAIRPGTESGFIDRSILGNPTNFTFVPLPGGVAFVGNDGVLGEEPWWSDGVGVEAIGDVRPGARGSEPRWLTAAGDTLFFAADDGMHGRELWRWRPGEAAALVADLLPGPGSSAPQELAGVDGLLYFSAFTPEAGVELWRSDGTAAGTVRLQDVWPGEESSTPSRLTASGRYLFFTADDGTHGREMWSLLLPTRRPRAFLTARGALVPGGEVVLTLRLENPPPEELPDGEGDELSLPLPALLEPIEVTATSGTAEVTVAEGATAAGAARLSAAAAAGGWLVTWNGTLPPGGVVEVVIVARVRAEATDGVSLQAAGTFDSDGDGGNDEAFVSDDPGSPADDDPTFLPFAVEIPALRASGLALFAAALALLAAARLRRAAA